MIVTTEKGVEVRYITVDHIPSKIYVTAYHEYAEGYKIMKASKAYYDEVEAKKQAELLTEEENKTDWDPATRWAAVEVDLVG